MIKVLIDLKDRQFGEKLACRLSCMSDKLSIDLENRGEYDCIIDDRTGEILPVSELLEHIIASYTEVTGKSFYAAENRLKKAFLFSSPEGGSGLSSVAFSFARRLAGSTGQKTLYADVGPYGRFSAGEYTVPARGDVRELEYLIRNNRLSDPMKYLSKDHFGPFVILTESEDLEMIMKLADAGNFTQIVLSSPGKTAAAPDDIINISLINAKDVRTAEITDVPEGFGYLLKNRDYANRVSGNIISIADDDLSFKLIDGSLSISMSGEFGIGIEKLVRTVIADEKNGFLWGLS